MAESWQRESEAQGGTKRRAGNRAAGSEPIGVVFRLHRLGVCAALLIIPFASKAARAQTAIAPIRTMLPSGAHLIVVPRPDATSTAIEVRVRVGSAMETLETNGLAHLIEHLVFKGAEDTKPGDIDAAIETLGGELKARTSRDSTAYTTVVPSSNWQPALTAIVRMLQKPAFRATDMDAEKIAIHGEMAETESTEERNTYADLAEKAFADDDPDRLRIMGDPKALDTRTPDEVRAFWQTWYRPENMTVVIVGAVTGDDVDHIVSALLPSVTHTATPKATPPTTASTEAPTAASGGIVRVQPSFARADGAVTTVTFAFNGPRSAEAALLPTVETIMPLLTGNNSRTYGASPGGWLGRALMERTHTALAVTSDYLEGRKSGLFFVTAVGIPNGNARGLERAVVAAIRNLREGMPDDDLILAARNAAANTVLGQDSSVSGMARRLADADAHGLPADLVDSYAERIRAVPPSEIRHVIEQFLTPERYFVETTGPDTSAVAYRLEQP